MDRKLLTPTVAALALVAVYGTANAASPGLVHTAAAVIAPAAGLDVADQHEVIAPPSDIDPGMTKRPPMTGARMPILTPPDEPGTRFGIQR
jgi:hypothetical protein